MSRILVDTSVWIDHFRQKDEHLVNTLEDNRVLTHPMIWGELACGHLQNLDQILSLFQNLPQTSEATHDEALYCLTSHNLMGQGIGFVDLHLLASTLLTKNTLIWTRDKRLHKSAASLKVSYLAPH